MQYIVGAIIAFYISLLILGKKQKVTADYILAAWSFTAGVHLTYIYYYASGNYIQTPELIGWNAPIPLVHGPFLYGYVLHITQQQKTRYGWLLNFVPFFLSYLYIAPYLLSLSPAGQIMMLTGKEAPEWKCEYLFPYVSMGIVCTGVIYTIASLFLLKKHKKNITEQFSNTDKITLTWVRYLIAGIGIIVVFFIMKQPQLTFLSVVLYIVILGYFGIRQVGIFNEPTLYREPPIDLPVNGNAEKTTEKVRYEKSNLTEVAAQKIQLELAAVMQKEKLFKDAELTLGALAKRLSVHQSVLSEVINTMEQKSFYDYINELRVAEFKALINLPENKKFTLLSLAFDCGFNSKSSFNRNFKKITQLSPSAYAKQNDLHFADE